MSNRIQLILEHGTYIECYNQIVQCEVTREFCKHDMVHFLDVARIAYILSLEEHANINKEYIYAAALLHDIGRHKQYQEGIPHEIASATLCEPILEACDFNQDEIEWIKEAILNHRNALVKDRHTLSGYLYRGDKASRACHSCHDIDGCNWENKKKNLKLYY